MAIKKRTKEFIVFGLGRFGGSLCKEFNEMGIGVLAVDSDFDRVQELSGEVTQALQIDATEPEALKSLGVNNFDGVVVSFGDNIQSSILATLLLKELGAKQVWVKAHSDIHHMVLEKIGADRIFHPEKDMAKRIAHHIGSDKIIDYIELSEEYSIAEIIATEKIAGQSLIELNIRDKFSCTIVAIKTKDIINVSPASNEIIKKGDILVTLGSNKDLERFEEEGI